MLQRAQGTQIADVAAIRMDSPNGSGADGRDDTERSRCGTPTAKAILWD